MIPQSKGKIYLSDERGRNEMKWFRTYNTFNFGRYFNEHKTPFGDLYVLNEDTLAPGKGFRMEIEEASDVILLPIVGAISVIDTNGHDSLLQAGQVQRIHFSAGQSFEVQNPYEDDLVKFLQLWIRSDQNIPATISSFDLNNKDQLLEILHTPSYSMSIAKFNGRAEGTYFLKDPNNGVFVFNIEGAFEVQYRLMHDGDGLALWELDTIEMEALSNNAILLIVEVKI
jgi:redox-sensitive bicupin YhaK (pirin superfamily)